jgi:hypothetical protein
MNERKTNLMATVVYIYCSCWGCSTCFGRVRPSSGALENQTSSIGILRGVLWALRWWWWCEAQRPQHTAQNTYATDLVF